MFIQSYTPATIKNMDSELQGWNEIIEEAGIDNAPSRAKAQAKATAKMVLAIKNLENAIFNHQKKTATRLDNLTESINRFDDNTGKLYKAGLWLSGAIALATIAQVIIAIAK